MILKYINQHNNGRIHFCYCLFDFISYPIACLFGNGGILFKRFLILVCILFLLCFQYDEILL